MSAFFTSNAPNSISQLSPRTTRPHSWISEKGREMRKGRGGKGEEREKEKKGEG